MNSKSPNYRPCDFMHAVKRRFIQSYKFSYFLSLLTPSVAIIMHCNNYYIAVGLGFSTT